MQARARQEPGSSRELLDETNAAGGVQQVVQAKAVEASRLRWSEMTMSVEVTVEAKVTKLGGTGHEKSEPTSSTEEAGEPDRRDPVEGRRRRS
jgi:hypothetical protein